MVEIQSHNENNDISQINIVLEISVTKIPAGVLTVTGLSDILC